MKPERLMNHQTDSGALHFQLSCNKEDVFSHLIALRQYAQDRVSKVSPIHRLYNEECLVEGYNDPLIDSKLMSQGIVLHDSKAIIVNPESIAVIAIKLNNGSIVYFGFATHPTSVFVNGKKIKFSSNDRATWSGLLFMKDSSNNDSYKELFDFLIFLKNRGVQVQMNNRLASFQYA